MDEREAHFLERLKSGDRAAFSELIEQQQDRVYNTVLGILGHAEDAEDVAQEVFVEVYNSVQSYRGDAALSTWLYRIAYTKALDFIRKKKRKKRFGIMYDVFAPEMQQAIRDDQDPFRVLELSQEKEGLLTAISKLPEKQKVALVLNKLEEQSYKEVAEAMKTSVSAVESLLHRAKRNLKVILENQKK